MPVLSNSRASSYRKAFGPTRGQFGSTQSINKIPNEGAEKTDFYTSDDIQAMYAAAQNKFGSPNERLGSLNSRFASYIEKVRFLEEQNRILELKIKAAQKRKSEIENHHDTAREIDALRIAIDQETMEKVKMQVERDNLKGDAVELSHKIEDEHTLRNDLTDELQKMRKDVDDATMVRVDLERKIETVQEELDYTRRVRAEEIEDLKNQISEQGISVEVDGVTPDMTLILAEIRKEYDVIAAKNRDEAEEWYKRKCSDLEEKSRSNQEELEKVNAEIAEYRKQVTRLEMELESLRGTNEYLERNLQDMEKRSEVEVQSYQARVSKLQAELDRAVSDMKRHLTEYKNLMSVKLSLEKEIDTYRSLLEGEEGRISTNGSSDSDRDDSSEDERPPVQIIKTPSKPISAPAIPPRIPDRPKPTHTATKVVAIKAPAIPKRVEPSIIIKKTAPPSDSSSSDDSSDSSSDDSDDSSEDSSDDSVSE
ncbi:Oidioi.mRNA.OKI2018_I69.PAR.g8495.t1.cds [Oikopleura dioica]|uniref:Oidioi.mRNA.OKI2018_I69.PAR.g8495.t1.cds n=1 Tax=Oikopleura dioica TaxID=34765 RepID=A0ABN7RJS6_OIKDI|nr:Oidioi.mRNA.OKI2018_I69.PAR.g8495.t1.cds [Oikopleura dioica]